MTRTQRQTTGRPPRARRSPSGSAATPQRSTPATRCRPLSSAELALVVGVLLGGTVEVQTAPATQTTGFSADVGAGRTPSAMPGRAGVPKSRARAGGRPACAVEGDHPVGPTMGTIWRAARGGDLCPIRTSASRIPGPARSHQFAPSPRRGAAFFRVTSPQGRARSPAPTALPAPRSPVGRPGPSRQHSTTR